MDTDMDTDTNESVLRAALGAAQAKHEAVRAEITELTAQLDARKTLDANLVQVVTSLQAILNPEEEVLPSEPVEAHIPERVVVTPTSHGPPTAAEDAGHVTLPLPQPPALSRRVSPTSSPYRMGLILRDEQRPMTRDAVVAEYLRRGWADSKWSDPTGAMIQALRRAVEYGWVRRLNGNRYITTQTPGDQPVGGDAIERVESWS